MSIVVTGAAGFIGSNLVTELNNINIDDIILVDTYRSFAKTWEYSLKYANYKLILEPYQFLNNYSKYDITKVFHIGAIADTQQPDLIYFKNNYEYTIKLIELYKQYSLNNDNAFFINASSSAVYGNNDNGPLNAYALSKKMIDNYIIQNFSNLNYKIVSFRFFNVFGPKEYHKGNMASMIYQLYNEYYTNHTLSIFNNGTQSRDHIYIKDLISILINYAFNTITNVNVPILDLGTGISTTFNKLLEIIKLELNDVFLPTNYIPIPDKIRKTYQNFTEAKLKFDYKFKYTLQEAIKEYYSILDYQRNY